MRRVCFRKLRADRPFETGRLCIAPPDGDGGHHATYGSTLPTVAPLRLNHKSWCQSAHIDQDNMCASPLHPPLLFKGGSMKTVHYSINSHTIPYLQRSLRWTQPRTRTGARLQRAPAHAHAGSTLARYLAVYQPQKKSPGPSLARAPNSSSRTRTNRKSDYRRPTPLPSSPGQPTTRRDNKRSGSTSSTYLPPTSRGTSRRHRRHNRRHRRHNRRRRRHRSRYNRHRIKLTQLLLRRLVNKLNQLPGIVLKTLAHLRR